MASKITNGTINELFGTIAVAQTVIEQSPFSLASSEKGYSCTFDLLSALYKMVAKEPLNVALTRWLSNKLADNSCSWLMYIEDTIKLALESNITKIMTCELSPLIPDRLMGASEFLEGSDRQINFSGDGITIPISAIDFTGSLKHSPIDTNDKAGNTNYLPCYKPVHENASSNVPLNTSFDASDVWKHVDFNAFLWYVKNMGQYGNLIERRKLIWDNRYKTKLFRKPEPKTEEFFTKSLSYDSNAHLNDTYPFDKDYLRIYNEKVPYKKKQILECRYIQGDGIQPDSFQFRLPASTYYKTRGFLAADESGEPNRYVRFNKSIFEFNHDFIASLKLFDVKTYLCQVITSLVGEGNLAFNASISKEEFEIRSLIDNLIIKYIKNSDIESVEDCYYTFSNDEYIDMLKTSAIKKRLYEDSDINYDGIFERINNLNIDNGDIHETETVINNTINEVTVTANTYTDSTYNFNYDYMFEFCRALIYPFVRPLFSPKIMTLMILNLSIMGEPWQLEGEWSKEKWWESLLPYISNIMRDIVIQIKDMLVEVIYSMLIEKLTPLLSLFTLKLLYEQVEMYRQLITSMIEACTFSGFNFNKQNSKIGDVRYVDIDYQTQDKQIKETTITKTNC